MRRSTRRISAWIHYLRRPIFDQALASKVRDSFDISLAFSTAGLSSPLFSSSSSDRSIVSAFYVGDRLLVVARLELRADSELAGQQVRDLCVNHHVFVVSHERGGRAVFYPDGDN